MGNDTIVFLLLISYQCLPLAMHIHGSFWECKAFQVNVRFYHFFLFTCDSILRFFNVVLVEDSVTVFKDRSNHLSKHHWSLGKTLSMTNPPGFPVRSQVILSQICRPYSTL